MKAPAFFLPCGLLIYTLKQRRTEWYAARSVFGSSFKLNRLASPAIQFKSQFRRKVGVHFATGTLIGAK